MLEFTLELINLFLLMKWVLGYKFRENWICLAAGTVLIVLHYAAFLWFPQELLIKLDFLWVVIPIVLPLLCFRGKWITLLGISVSMRMVFQLSGVLCLGSSMVIAKGHVEDLSMVLAYTMGQGICTAVLIVMSYVLRNQRNKVHFHVEKLNPLFFVPFIVCMEVLTLDAGYSGQVPKEQVQIVHGINLLKRGLLAVFLIIIFVLVYVLISQRKELKRMLLLNEKCIREQTEQYQLIGQRDEELRKFHHDYSEHIAVIHDMAQMSSREELVAYIEQMDKVVDTAHFISTNNLICDAIVNRYAHMCRNEGIELIVMGKLPEQLDIPETSLCVLLSNGIKNAYEAVQKCTRDRKISFDIVNNEGYIFITIKNPAVDFLKFKEETPQTTKTDGERHGFGTKNMLEAAMQNGGNVKWYLDEEGLVVTEIRL